MTTAERMNLLADAIRATRYYLKRGQLLDWREKLDELAEYADMIPRGWERRYGADLQPIGEEDMKEADYELQRFVEDWRGEITNGED
jgi:hypothetical protein